MEDQTPKETNKEEKSHRPNRRERRYLKKNSGKIKAGNDFSYWNKYPELMGAATKFPWNYIPGTEIFVDSRASNKITFHNVLAVEYVTTIGVSRANTDPFNLQMRKTWLDMHRKYRGLGAYQQADLGIMMFCVKEVFSGLGECARIYGIYASYPVKNRILPRGILKAIGYNDSLLSSIESNLADFLYGINRLVRKARQLCLPKNISCLLNQLGLNACIYTDSKDARASLIAFKPTGYWHYKDTALTSGSAAYLKPLVRSNQTLYPTYLQFLAYFENMIDILLNDDDIARVCSDLIACYGDEGVEALVPFEESFAVVPEYSEEILTKLHNSEIFGGERLGYDMNFVSKFPNYTLFNDAIASETPSASSFTYLWIVQNDNTILFQPCLVTKASTDTALLTAYTESDGTGVFNGPATPHALTGYYVSGGAHPVDTWEENPDESVACEANLWKVVSSPMPVHYESGVSKNQGSIDVLSCSTEIILDIQSCKVVNSTVTAQIRIPMAMNVNTISTNAVKGLCHFDWHPIIPLLPSGLASDGSGATDVQELFGDIDNLTFVSGYVIQKIHDAALLSGFAIDATVNK